MIAGCDVHVGCGSCRHGDIEGAAGCCAVEDCLAAVAWCLASASWGLWL